MSIAIRAMADGEADAIAGMIRGLARDTGARIVPEVTGEALRQSRDLIEVLVAEDQGRLAGVCLGLMTFSTWRGTRGLYVVDLYVEPEARGRNIGLLLLREQARRAGARGARFIKLEVDKDNAGAARFYGRIGFRKKPEDRLYILEQDELERFVAGGAGT